MVWAPLGINVAWTTCVPLLAIISTPIQKMFGLVAAYNALVTMSMPAAAWCAFLLCRHLTHRFWPALIGGYLFGFSPYMLGQAFSHLHLIAVFPIPLIVLVVIRRMEGEISPARYVAALAALLVIEFLCAIELYATLTFFGSVAYLLALCLFKRERRRAIAGLIAPTAAAYAVSAAVLSPYLYFILRQGFPGAPLWNPAIYSIDLLNLAVPTTTMWLGTAHVCKIVADRFAANLMENSAYIGIPMLVVAEDFRRRNWVNPAGKFLILLLLLALLVALGPSLRIMGKPTIALPWALMLKVPALASALPARFTMYASLTVAVIGALWFAGERSIAVKSMAAAAIVISFFPNPHAAYWVSAIERPAFFATDAYRAELKPNELVLVLPFGQRGFSMYWQALTGLYFRMAGGYTGPWQLVLAPMPVAQYLYAADDLPEAGDQLKAYLARFHVEAIAADEQDSLISVWTQMLDSLGIAPLRRDGFLIYNLPRDAFARYGKLSQAYLEARAVALRLDTILPAVAKYLTTGREPAELSPPNLKREGLLPPGWIIDPLTNAFWDWDASSLPDGRIAIVLLASYPAAKLLIDRYRDAAEIRYPMDRPWNLDAAPPPNPQELRMLLLTFDRAHLAAAAERLRSSPPPETTTPFLAGPAALLR